MAHSLRLPDVHTYIEDSTNIDSHLLQSHAETGLPEGWEVRRSNTRNLPYYFHPVTKDSRWEPPVGTDPEKLKAFMAEHHSTKGISESTLADKKDKIRCAHLLVKHAESRRPASWRETKITRTKEEAYEILAAHEKEIARNTNGEEGARSLSELATTESDCSSARKGGDL